MRAIQDRRGYVEFTMAIEMLEAAVRMMYGLPDDVHLFTVNSHRFIVDITVVGNNLPRGWRKAAPVVHTAEDGTPHWEWNFEGEEK